MESQPVLPSEDGAQLAAASDEFPFAPAPGGNVHAFSDLLTVLFDLPEFVALHEADAQPPRALLLRILNGIRDLKRTSIHLEEEVRQLRATILVYQAIERRLRIDCTESTRATVDLKAERESPRLCDN